MLYKKLCAQVYQVKVQIYFDVMIIYTEYLFKFLSYEKFKWTDTVIDSSIIPDHSRIGYSLEMDLEYPNVFISSTKINCLVWNIVYH